MACSLSLLFFPYLSILLYSVFYLTILWVYLLIFLFKILLFLLKLIFLGTISIGDLFFDDELFLENLFFKFTLVALWNWYASNDSVMSEQVKTKRTHAMNVLQCDQMNLQQQQQIYSIYNSNNNSTSKKNCSLGAAASSYFFYVAFFGSLSVFAHLHTCGFNAGALRSSMQTFNPFSM